MPCVARLFCSTLLQGTLLQKDTGQAQEAQAQSEKADLALGGFSASRPGRTGSHGGRSGSPRGCAVLAGMLVVWAQSGALCRPTLHHVLYPSNTTRMLEMAPSPTYHIHSSSH